MPTIYKCARCGTTYWQHPGNSCPRCEELNSYVGPRKNDDLVDYKDNPFDSINWREGGRFLRKMFGGILIFLIVVPFVISLPGIVASDESILWILFILLLNVAVCAILLLPGLLLFLGWGRCWDLYLKPFKKIWACLGLKKLKSRSRSSFNDDDVY